MQLRKRRKRQESSSFSGSFVLRTFPRKTQDKQRAQRSQSNRVSSSNVIKTRKKTTTIRQSSTTSSSSADTGPPLASSVSIIDLTQEDTEKKEEKKKQKKDFIESNHHEKNKLTHFFLLQSAVTHEDAIDDTNWLTSTFIDLTLWKMANLYPSVYFLPTDFVHLYLLSCSGMHTTFMSSSNSSRSSSSSSSSSSSNRSTGSRQKSRQDFQVYDLLGRLVDYESCQSIVFVANIGHIHWNMFRVQLAPSPELQLFEPMGRPATRKGTRTTRSVPRQVIEWLDICFPQYQKWMDRTVSAITKQQQFSGFDCGVACLLYAEKCGKGQLREDINEWTNQIDITTFRKKLQSQLKQQLSIQQTNTNMSINATMTA